MRLIEPSVELLNQPPGLQGIYDMIELCGKTSYKSPVKGGKDAEDFTDARVNEGHYAVLEFGTVYLTIPLNEWICKEDYMESYPSNPYSKCNEEDVVDFDSMQGVVYITTNLRVLVEKGWVRDLEFITEPTDKHYKRYTARIVTDRGVTHELVRHRSLSFVQESTRFCNYSKDKFGNELTFIKPSWYSEVTNEQREAFEDYLEISEEAYMALLGKWENRKPDKRYKTEFKGNPLTPQQTRQVLPNALKTEICVCGFKDAWEHLFELRYFGMTGKPHPDMLKVSTMLYKAFVDAGIKL